MASLQYIFFQSNIILSRRYEYDEKNIINNSRFGNAVFSQRKCPTTLLLGFGATYNKFRFEYRIYDITYSIKYNGQEYEYFGSTNVISLGYKYEF